MLRAVRKNRGFYSTISEFILSNKRCFLLACMFLAGVFFGTSFFTASSGGTVDNIASLCSLYISTRLEKSFYEVFLSAFYPSFWIYAVLFFLGFCALAQPLIVLAPLFYGLGIGFIASYLYTSSNGMNLILAVFILMPASIVSGFTVIMASRSSLYLSSCFFAKIDSSNNRDMLPVLKRYFFQYTVYAVMCAVSALLNAGAFYAVFNLK